MSLGTSLGTVASAVVWGWAAIVDSPCIGVDTGGASVTRGCMVCGAGDATVGVMGKSATSSMDGRLLDLSLFTALFVAGIMGGGGDTLGCSAMGATCVDTSCSESCKFSTTCSKLRVALLSCVAAVTH